MEAKKVVLGCALVVLALCGVGGYFLNQKLDFMSASAQLDQAVEEYRAEGLPWTQADLKVRIYPPNEDAEPLLKEAMMAEPNGKLPLSVPKLKKWVEYPPAVAASEKSMRLLRKACLRTGANRHWDYDLGFDLLLPELERDKIFCRALCASAEYRAHTGDLDGAAADLRACNQLIRWEGENLTMISSLVAVAMDAISNKTTRSCMAEVSSNSTDIVALEGCRPHYQPDVQRTMSCEAFLFIAGLRNFHGTVQTLTSGAFGDSESDSDANRSYPIQRSGLPKSIIFRAYLTRSLQFWTKLYPQLSAKSLRDQYEVVQRIENEPKPDKVSYLMLKASQPEYSICINSMIKAQADDEVTKAYADILIYRNAHGAFPRNLLDVGHYRDPFSQGDLMYRREPHGFRVYSLGTARKDFHGLVGREVSEAAKKRGDFNLAAVFPPLPEK
jgi:hypothetical protein